MPIANKFVREFDAVTRAGGAEDFENGHATVGLVSEQALQVAIGKSPVIVTLSWSEAETLSKFSTRCTCAAFQKYPEFCHHGWTALLKFDSIEQPEILEIKARLEKKTLTLKRMSESEAAAALSGAVDLNQISQWPNIKISPVGLFQFTENKSHDGFTLTQIQFTYGDFKVEQTSPRREFVDRSEQRKIKRNQSAEKELLKNLKGDLAPKKIVNKKFSSTEFKDFVSANASAEWTVVIDDKPVVALDLKEARLQESESHYEFTAEFTAKLPSGPQTFTLGDVIASNDTSLLKLKDGSPAFVTEAWAKRLEILSRGAEPTKEGALRFKRSSLPLFKSAFEGAEHLHISAEAKEVFQKLESLGEAGQAPAPTSLRASLRSYQEEGLFWLLKMSKSGFGGVLADDMGLGKTIQIISYFLTRKLYFKTNVTEKKPSLVVVPKSLVSNWKNEIEKFAPSLAILDFAGPNRVIFRPHHFDVVITTYHVMKNEIDRLREVDFETIILDEAQAIKNPTSQIAKAAFQLKARQRFALSGTPIENSLKDLFSLLHFTNPGLIPSSFDRIYGEKKSLTLPKAVLEKIATSVRPFILRRTKKQVLTELPDKSEQVLFCDMDTSQKSLYEKTRKHFKVKLKESADETPSGPKATRVFEALLRLRQISCHPKLIGEAGLNVESTKVEALLEHLEDIQASGNKALVFSQFTSFLDLIKPALEKAAIPFEHLDGQTRNRGAVVDRFNANPKTTVFLISLKAGGTGLNLTTASYVFLMDPWWNPAIESQAIDRAYRMGQKQKVMAYRLIAKGTIEEKIMKLQDQKRHLAQAMISEDDSLASSLSLEDLEFLLEE